MDDVSEQLARRDRVRRHLEMKKTPDERMADMARLQARAWEILRNSPEGFAWFVRRNYKARAIQVRNEWQG
jgi:hypothetical protein